MFQAHFPGKTVHYYLPAAFHDITNIAGTENILLLTDQHVADAWGELIRPYPAIILPPGEEQKHWGTIDSITKTLIARQAHKKTMLAGVGGGVITDITGFVASIYMRGIPFGLVPTTLLGMADAAVGGKNGINAGSHKNMLGTITQPDFILYDFSFLKTLPAEEWSNGFAEIIKYACVFDAALFDELSRQSIHYYQNNASALQQLTLRCVQWKNKTVLEDERDDNKRKLLNFGHTAGHALEIYYHLPHGHAVAIGMIIALYVSEQVNCLDVLIKERVRTLLQQYNLPVYIEFDLQKVMELLAMDKKRESDKIDYITLESTGRGIITPVSLDIIELALKRFSDAGDY